MRLPLSWPTSSATHNDDMDGYLSSDYTTTHATAMMMDGFETILINDDTTTGPRIEILGTNEVPQSLLDANQGDSTHVGGKDAKAGSGLEVRPSNEVPQSSADFNLNDSTHVGRADGLARLLSSASSLTPDYWIMEARSLQNLMNDKATG